MSWLNIIPLRILATYHPMAATRTTQEELLDVKTVDADAMDEDVWEEDAIGPSDEYGIVIDAPQPLPRAFTPAVELIVCYMPIMILSTNTVYRQPGARGPWGAFSTKVTAGMAMRVMVLLPF